MHALVVLAIYMIYACPRLLFNFLFMPKKKYYSSSKNLTKLLFFSLLGTEKKLRVFIYLNVSFFFVWLLTKHEERKIEEMDGK